MCDYIRVTAQTCVYSELPSDVVAFAAGSSVMACGGAVVGFHTARHVSLADVFISQSRVGGSSSWQTAGVQCWGGEKAENNGVTLLIFPISLKALFVPFRHCFGETFRNHNLKTEDN